MYVFDESMTLLTCIDAKLSLLAIRVGLIPGRDQALKQSQLNPRRSYTGRLSTRVIWSQQ